MRTLTAAQVAQLAGGELVGDGTGTVGPDVVIDSRRVTPGALFVALAGEHADGHRFVAAALAAGAGAVLVGHAVADADGPQIVVADALAGLTRLARALTDDAVARTGLVTLALTGSAGKTTTKDLLAHILAGAGATVAPAGSLNNEIGVPLTACRIDDATRFLVVEMGARGPGHVAHLCGIVPPQISAVLNVGTAHLGEFGSREMIAKSKGEIVEALPAHGWAVLNADDPLVAPMAGRTRADVAWCSAGAPVVSGGQLAQTRLRVDARGIEPDDLERYGFVLAGHRDGEGFVEPVQLRLVGRHQVANALAAAGMALAAGLEPALVAQRLSTATEDSPWRMELHPLASGAVLVNDAYNANPDSMRAALATVARMAASRRAGTPDARAVAVLGDMLELGETSARMHYETGSFAAGLGIEVIALGEHAGDTVAGARSAGGTARVARTDEVPQLLA
ncbi:MAG: UDP-N-acetylmuramoyl-tripeptide--D-alanyl-D-alanine ligase, partial [Propionibacteriaceae bacterium]|nr:UDP-N-acetylmuramoyl-tripeptide--D-alanyl-D-alanine ligase [Propionibacteriaceae bacterium]